MGLKREKTARRTHPALWERVKAEVTASDKGGRPGQWSARKAQFAVAEYKARGGGYIGPKTPDNSLVKWTREEWRTRSGLPSLETGERYLPKRAIAALTASEYAATSAKKRVGMRRGQQFVPQPESVAMKTAQYRQNGRKIVAYLVMWGWYWYSCDDSQWKRLMAHVRRTGGEFGLDDPSVATSLKNPPKDAYKDESGRWNMASSVPFGRATDFYLDDWEAMDKEVRRYTQQSAARRNPEGPNPRTVTQVTKAAREALGDPELEFVRGDGYYYVLYGKNGMTGGFGWGSRLSERSMAYWIREIREAIEAVENR